MFYYGDFLFVRDRGCAGAFGEAARKKGSAIFQNRVRYVLNLDKGLMMVVSDRTIQIIDRHYFRGTCSARAYSNL